MMGDRFKDEEHLVRLAGLFAAGVLVFFVLQALLVPKGFGLYGHFRAGALGDARARPVAYAGRAACEECHSDVADARKGSKHEGVGCETCHGPLATHAAGEGPGKPRRPDAQVCLVCHTANVGKPAGFPQIDPKEHAEPGSCLTCHAPHHPERPPESAPEKGPEAKP